MTGVYSVLGFVAKLGAIERDMHGRPSSRPPVKWFTMKPGASLGRAMRSGPRSHHRRSPARCSTHRCSKRENCAPRLSGSRTAWRAPSGPTTIRLSGTNSARHGYRRVHSSPAPRWRWNTKSTKWPRAPRQCHIVGRGDPHADPRRVITAIINS
jgi:hypothetical protein